MSLFFRFQIGSARVSLVAIMIETNGGAHDRMPVILERDDYGLWLDPGFKDLSALAEMIRPFNAGLMKSYPVSTRVNAPRNDDPECAAEIALQGATDRAEQLLPGIPSALA